MGAWVTVNLDISRQLDVDLAHRIFNRVFRKVPEPIKRNETDSRSAMTNDLLSAIEAEIASLRRPRAILDAGSSGTRNKAVEIPKPKRIEPV